MPTPHLRRASTLAKIRFLRHIAPEDTRRRGGRMPRQQQPDAIRLAYYRMLWEDVRRALEPLIRTGPLLVRMLTDVRTQEQHIEQTARAVELARGDASGNKPQADELVKRALARADELLEPAEIAASARKTAKRTDEFNKEQLGKQTQQALGIPYVSIEKSTRDVVPSFVAENVSLVKTLPERYHDRLAGLVEEAFSSGMRPETLASRIAELEDISESDAMRIARDQVGKLNGEFNMLRQTDMGVERYIWRTMNDDRVRDEHSDREGESFAWDDPPDGGHPGEDIQCRCYAEPDFSAILAGLDE